MANRNSNYNGRDSTSRPLEHARNKSEQLENSDSEDAVFDSWPPEALTDGEQRAARMSSF